MALVCLCGVLRVGSFDWSNILIVQCINIKHNLFCCVCRGDVFGKRLAGQLRAYWSITREATTKYSVRIASETDSRGGYIAY